MQFWVFFSKQKDSEVFQKTKIKFIQEILTVDKKRWSILKSIGQLSRMIFKSSAVSILPKSLAVVIPVLDMAIQSKATSSLHNILMDQNKLFLEWNITFGLILANSDLFFEVLNII